jgi:hypothetical protein
MVQITRLIQNAGTIRTALKRAYRLIDGKGLPIEKAIQKGSDKRQPDRTKNNETPASPLIQKK